jgi:hypothetical protein
MVEKLCVLYWNKTADVSLKHILPATRLVLWMHERNTVYLHIQVFLRINT